MYIYIYIYTYLSLSIHIYIYIYIEVVGDIGVGQDITELRSESKMLANYVRICGAAVLALLCILVYY